jgi:succinate-acetate transporter protein
MAFAFVEVSVFISRTRNKRRNSAMADNTILLDWPTIVGLAGFSLTTISLCFQHLHIAEVSTSH